MTGDDLADIRKRAGLTQAELTKRARIGRHAVSYWETQAEVRGNAWAVKRMAEVIPLPHLLTGLLRIEMYHHREL